MSNETVGISSVVLCVYIMVLLGIHARIPHPSVTKRAIGLSYISLGSFALAQAAIAGTYYVPHISGDCMCRGLWSAALFLYVGGLYAMKFVYVERIADLNKHPMLASNRIEKWIKIIAGCLIFSWLVSVVMMFLMTDGECHEDLKEYGCKPSFHVADVYLAIFMIIWDATWFAAFSYRWSNLIQVLRSNLSADNQMVVEWVQCFRIQCILTIAAMVSCLVDGIINLWHPGYSTLIIFCIDCAIISSCNFALIIESREVIWKYVCWPCRKSTEDRGATQTAEDNGGCNVQLTIPDFSASIELSDFIGTDARRAEITSSPSPSILTLGTLKEESNTLNTTATLRVQSEMVHEVITRLKLPISSYKISVIISEYAATAFTECIGCEEKYGFIECYHDYTLVHGAYAHCDENGDIQYYLNCYPSESVIIDMDMYMDMYMNQEQDGTLDILCRLCAANWMCHSCNNQFLSYGHELLLIMNGCACSLCKNKICQDCAYCYQDQVFCIQCCPQNKNHHRVKPYKHHDLIEEGNEKKRKSRFISEEDSDDQDREPPQSASPSSSPSRSKIRRLTIKKQ